MPRAEPDGELTRTSQGHPPWGGRPPSAVPEWQTQLSALQRTPQESHQERLGVPRKDWVSPEGRGAGTTLTPQSSISARAPGVGAVSETQTPAPHPSESPGQRQPTDQALGRPVLTPPRTSDLLLTVHYNSGPARLPDPRNPWAKPCPLPKFLC